MIAGEVNELTIENGAPAKDDIVSIFTRRTATPRRVALIGGFAPRKCGIATFTTDIFEQLTRYHPNIGLDVWAVDDPAAPLSYDRTRGTIRADRPEDYIGAAEAMNAEGVDAVWLQHEYGIFGGESGEMILELVDRVAAPLIVTLHTVLLHPSDRQRSILERLVGRASRVMVMSRQARDTLIEHYGASPERVAVIAHGAPDRPFGREEEFKARMGLAGRRVLMTFGLLGPGKGLETMIAALPAIVAEHSDVVYRIVGATHPNLVAVEGEAYRERLQALADELGVADHVMWDNRFLETPDLLDQLEACDIYVTPYPNLQQSTSGTLSYAVALGKAVVATPYVHAVELHDDGVGVLVEPQSPPALASAINELLSDPALLAATRERAYAVGRTTIWPRFADAGAALIESVVARATSAPRLLDIAPGFDAVLAMSDSTGIYQHAIGVVPDRRHGYCIDDNARALMLTNVAARAHPEHAKRLAVTYASFVQHAWNPDRGAFRNFMAFDRTWCEDVGSEDSNGRTLWALGETAMKAPDSDIREWARGCFDDVLTSFDRIDSPRAVAFAMLGCCARLKSEPDHASALALLERGGMLLCHLLASGRRPDWAWFEAVLAYDNPRLPQALLEAGMYLERAEWITAGIETLDWIAQRQVSATGNFRPVGSEGFGQAYDQLPFDQQPLEPWAAIDASAAAHAATGDRRWLAHARLAYAWFFGANDRGTVLADLASGRCRDGLMPHGANRNCGAESILAFHLAHYALAALERSGKESPREIDVRGDRFGPGTRSVAENLAHP